MVFASMTPIPHKFDLDSHVNCLRQGFDESPYRVPPGHYTNLKKKLIALYGSGERQSNEEIWLVEGEIVTKEEAFSSSKRTLLHNCFFDFCVEIVIPISAEQSLLWALRGQQFQAP